MASPVRTPYGNSVISSPPMVCTCDWQKNKDRQARQRIATPPMDIRPMIAVATPGNPLPNSLRGRVTYSSNTPFCRVIPGHRNG